MWGHCTPPLTQNGIAIGPLLSSPCWAEPRRDPSVIKIDNDRAAHWLSTGAQPTERVEKLLKISGAWEQAGRAQS